MELIMFVVAGERWAVPVAAVERVFPMVAVAPLPGCPDVVLGAINVHGEIVPVFDPHCLLGAPAVVGRAEAQLLLVRTPRRLLALAVDEVVGVAEVPAVAVAPAEAVHHAVERLAGVAPLPDGLLLVHDVDAFLSGAEERQLEVALEGAAL